jgi:hypothetical protein
MYAYIKIVIKNMRKRKILSILMLLLALVCSSTAMAQTRTKKTAKTTKTTKTATPTFIMTEEGLDAVKIGMDFKTLPASVAGLYSAYDVQGDCGSLDDPDDPDVFDCYLINFTSKGYGEMQAEAKKTGEITNIFNSTKRVKAKIGDTLIGVGSKFSALKKLPGAIDSGYGEIIIGKFHFLRDDGMEYSTDTVAYFYLDYRE